MNKLISSNIYRIIHYKKALVCSVLGVIFVTILNLLYLGYDFDGNLSDITGYDYLFEFFDSEFILIYLAIIVTMICSKSIVDKTINYEVINGYSWRDITFSKIITIALFQIPLICISQFIVFLIIALKNRMGEGAGLFFILLEEMILLLTFIIFFAFIVFIFKRIIISAIISIAFVVFTYYEIENGHGLFSAEFHKLSYDADFVGILIDLIVIIVSVCVLFFISNYIYEIRKRCK